MWTQRLLNSSNIMPGMLLLLGLGLTAKSALWWQNEIDLKAKAQFERSVEQVTAEIRSRFRQPIYGLSGTKGLYAAIKQVRRSDFQAYVESRNLPREFPGVRGFGFIQRVMRPKLDEFVAAERGDGAPQFVIRQLSDKSHDDLYVIKLIEPAADNLGAEGLDVGSEARRRAAILHAIDSGEPTVTSAIMLVQDRTKAPGMLLYVPVYAQGSQPASVAQRRALLVGVLYAPIVIAELLDKVTEATGRYTDFELFDSVDRISAANLVFDSDNHAAGLPNPADPPPDRHFSITQTLSLPGRDCTIRVNSTPQFDASLDHAAPWLIFSFGALISTLLALLVRQQATGRRRAELLAQHMTADLARLAQVVRHTTNAVTIAGLDSRISWVNEGFTRITGYTADEALGKTPAELLGSSKDKPAMDQAVADAIAQGTGFRTEMREHTRDGREYWSDIEFQPMRDAQGQIAGFMEIRTDITERKKAETELRIAATAFESHEGMVVTDANGVIMRANRAFTELTGYAAEEIVGQTPRILKSGRHSDDFYRQMWETAIRTGVWHGEIWDRRKNGEVYQKSLTISAVKNDDGVITHYIGTQHDITERKQAEEKIKELAYFDQLTGLPNRVSLKQKLAQVMGLARRNARAFALMLIDLDKFKIINDTLGHQTGDALLVQVAERLGHSVRQSDLVARLGGDEFVILLPDIDGPADVAHVAEKILTEVSKPYLIDGQELRTSPSIGICLYPDDANDGEDLVKKADVAMYHAKSCGRGNYQFFKAEIQAAAVERLAIEADLRLALAKRQFVLHYQPQLDLRSGRLVGVEALLRWLHPERGTVSPLDFIPIAEESGLILPIGDWVLAEACRQLAEWRGAGMAHIRVSVNLAASQFADDHLPQRIQAILQETGLPASSLDLEVTESMTMKSPADAAAMMKVLAAQALSLSIDDFGTGYSSLAYLKLFPISTLKIDRSFVKDIETDQNDADICDVTVLLAHKLGLNVVAEGVETDAQLKYLLSIGCEKIQGYLISKPLPADSVERFIRNHVPMGRLGTVDLWSDS